MPSQPALSVLMTTALSLLAAGCSFAVADGGAGDGAHDRLRVWRHSGTAAEREVFARQVRRFNRAQDEVRVTVRTIPEGDYNDVVQAGVAAGRLPDVLDLDGPTVASYVYQEALVPLDGLLPRAVLRRQLPSLRSQGTVDGTTWAVGTFDSGLGLFGSRSLLAAAGVTPPARGEPAWTRDEFDAALRALAGTDADGRVLDLKLNYGTGEWLTYGFGPLLSSAGGGLLDPSTNRATGLLDGDASVGALTDLARWADLADPNEDDRAFVDGRVALSWVGHWAYPAYAEALGDDLVVLPLPDMGRGTKTGQGSWAWAVTAPPARQAAAATFLRFLLRDRQVLETADANGAVPGTRAALRRSELYQTGGPLRLLADQLVDTCADRVPDLACTAVPRPATAGYPVVTAEVSRAVAAAMGGADPGEVLRRAARTIDEDQAANSGY